MTSPNKSGPRLFVGSLPYKYTEGQLLSLFAPFGRIIAISIIHNQWGKSRGLGFVEFDNVDSAIKAKHHLHNFTIEDRTIIVDFSKPDPFATPEGQLRHLNAQQRKGKLPKKSPPPKSLPTTEDNSHQFKNFNSGLKRNLPKKHLRQSVFDSRFHGARVGRKFAHKNKKTNVK